MAPKKAGAKPKPVAKQVTPVEEDDIDDKKRKAEVKDEDTEPKKEAKLEVPNTEGEAEVVDVPEEKKETEKEKDAPVDKRAVLKEIVRFLPTDTTLNVVPAMEGSMLMSLSEGGLQYMIAGARANVGIKAFADANCGRYMYELKIIESLNPSEASGQRGRAPMPRNLVRLGFSTDRGGLILGDTEEGICFDSEGHCVVGKGKRVAVSQKFGRDQTMGVLLNRDSTSPNANTISLFRDGVRIAGPQPLPDNLKGKTLFPHVSFRSVTVEVNFGPTLLKELPFKCRTLQGAAQQDVTIIAAPTTKDGTYEILMPVAFPDEGTFGWLDGFLAKNPKYVELSDRAILDWAASSGLWKPKSTGAKANSNDRPDFNFGIPGMDDASIRKVLYTIAPLIPRNYLIMEVKSNLIRSEREEILKRFRAPHFKKVAHVVMGEPKDEFKSMQLDKFRKDKQAKADIAWRAKKAEEQRKKIVEERQKLLVEQRKKAEEQRKKLVEDAQKKREELKLKNAAERKAKEEAKAELGLDDQKVDDNAASYFLKEGEVKTDPYDMQTEETTAMETDETKEEVKDEVKQEYEKKEDEIKEEIKQEEPDDSPPVVELTDEEKNMWFRPLAPGVLSDLSSFALNQSFSNFSIPGEDEGFQELRFEWQPAAESKDYLRKWVLHRKLMSRIEDLQPGKWFRDKQAEWSKTYTGWQTKQKEYKNSPAKKAKDEEVKKKEEAARKAEEDGVTVDVDVEMEGEELDVFSVQDIGDVGNGEPLFANFAFEDWALVQLRMEMYFLQAAYRKDVDDPERIGIHESHIAFYYNKYFRKQFNPKHFNLSTNEELLGLIKDTVKIGEDSQVLITAGFVKTHTQDEEMQDYDVLVKLTEEVRRERQRRIDAGDETAKVKFSPLAMQQPPAHAPKAPPKAPVPGAAAPKAPPGATWLSQPNFPQAAQFRQPFGPVAWSAW